MGGLSRQPNHRGLLNIPSLGSNPDCILPWEDSDGFRVPATSWGPSRCPNQWRQCPFFPCGASRSTVKCFRGKNVEKIKGTHQKLVRNFQEPHQWEVLKHQTISNGSAESQKLETSSEAVTLPLTTSTSPAPCHRNCIQLSPATQKEAHRPGTVRDA